MAAYLQDHPPARSQYRKGRRATPTGTIVLHTYEIQPDLVGPDTRAEEGASYISRRTDAPGSYHLLGDRDSDILVVPLEWEAFHDGTGSNPWSVGISLAITAKWFRNAPDDQKLWYMARLATMARKVSDWLEANHGITVPARRLTKTSQREAGFCTHMDRENWAGTPGRRSDPWGTSDEMWHLFLTLYEDTAQHQENDDMSAKDVQQITTAIDNATKALAKKIDDESDQTRANVRDRISNFGTVMTREVRARNAASTEVLLDAIRQLSGGDGTIDYVRMEEAAEKAVRKVLGSLDD